MVVLLVCHSRWNLGEYTLGAYGTKPVLGWKGPQGRKVW
jgi:hypothetical protein